MTDTNDKDGVAAKSKYGAAFAARLFILISLLALVGAGLYYDRVVLPPQTQKAINDAYALMQSPDDTGSGISNKEVQEAIGFPPSNEAEKDGFAIQTYEFKRALPFAKGNYLTVVYEHGSLVNILQDKPYSLDAVRPDIASMIKKPGPEFKGRTPGSSPFESLGGAGSSDDDGEDKVYEDGDENYYEGEEEEEGDGE